jgi:tetratricopeptide (TPR) repeat protein
MEDVMRLFRKKRLPYEYQVEIVANQFTKDELQSLMREYDLTATELNLVGNAFRTMDDLKLAERTFKKSISKDKGYDEPYGNLLSLYCLQKRYDEGRALLDDALKHARKRSFVWYHFGRMCALSGDYNSAVDAAYAALEGENYEFEAAYELGVRALLARIGQNKSENPEKDVEDAYALLTAGLSKFPDSAELKELAEVFEDD